MTVGLVSKVALQELLGHNLYIARMGSCYVRDVVTDHRIHRVRRFLGWLQ